MSLGSEIMEFKANILDENGMRRALVRLSHEIIEKNKGIENLVIVGIKTRGVFIAKELGKNIEDIEGCKIPVESLDISMYRDDLQRENDNPVYKKNEFNSIIENKIVVLVDDVIYTGRTVRAALDALFEYGRPSSIQLAVLVDRGHRELPIRADYVGKNVPTSKKEVVKVRLLEVDGINEVSIYELE
jgi:pyrimidine operon attenuation protein/uracil phosphoribosyltransferase